MIKKIFSSKLVVGVLVSVISTFIVSAITALYKQINIIQGIKQVFQWIIFFFSYKLPIYGFILIIIGLIVINKIVMRSKKDDKGIEKGWLNYKKDYYKNWIFAWDYYLTSNYQYSMKNLRPICKCGCELSLKGSIGNSFYTQGVFVCPKCNTTYPFLDEETMEDFKKIVGYNIKSGEYTKDTSTLENN